MTKTVTPTSVLQEMVDAMDCGDEHGAGSRWYEDAVAALAASPPPAVEPVAAHPDDEAVDRFAAAMKEKLAKKRAEGRDGWDQDNKAIGVVLSRLLREHVEKGDPLDVGNLAMMIHQRGETIR